MPRESPDPRTIDVLVVHAEDVVAALAATTQDRETVLRVTPPFRRRQRARIHVPSESDVAGATGRDEEPPPLLVRPGAFVDADAPGFPRAPDTEPAPAESPAYDVDEHFDQHAAAVAAWRERVREHFTSDVAVDGPNDERCAFEVRYLGD